jgi:heme exporter protein A
VPLAFRLASCAAGGIRLRLQTLSAGAPTTARTNQRVPLDPSATPIPPSRLRARDLVVRRGARTIIAGLSLDVAPGDVLLLRGPNGAGKTTLLRALAGLLPVAAGSIALEGADGPLELAESCHYVGHRNGLKAALTVAENAAFWGAYLDPGRGEDFAASVHGALDRFGLAPLADIPAGYLSAGQQRRLALTRLVLAHRPVWLLDEPTVSLDASAAALLAATIEAHVGAGGIAVAATHVELGLNAARELRLGAGAAQDASARAIVGDAGSRP